MAANRVGISKMTRGTWLAVWAAVATAGCLSEPAPLPPIAPPPLAPEAVAAAVIQEADVDGDGVIEKNEFDRMPALAEAIQDFDQDRDGGVSAAELQRWLEDVKASGLAQRAVEGKVLQRNKPMANVTVKFVPEPCMGGRIKAAEAVTDEGGYFSATIPGAKYRGVHCGFYRIELTGTTPDGQPLPAHYNTQTTLGVAIGTQNPKGDLTLTLE